MSQITDGSSSLPDQPRRNSLARRGVAVLVLLILGWLVLHLVIHIVLAIATAVVLVAAVGAAIWAARVLL
jgi:hypothetical protein